MKPTLQFFRSFICLSTFILFIFNANAQDGAQLYGQNCAQCHGANLTGGNSGSLVDGIWQFGASDGHVFKNIKFGITHLGMPSYESTLEDKEIRAILKYVREAEKKVGAEKPPIAKELETLDYKIKVEIFAEGLEVPWAIDFLDAKTALITERPGRLRIVKNGKLQAEPIKNTPVVLNEGQGGLMDVAIDPDYDDLMQIKQNSNRAAALIGQLLAFSRKQTLRPKSLHLNETLAELSHLLNRLLGGKVALHTDNGKNLKTVRVDERQFEQVIMNLVVNARDAMPNGGTVMLRTRNHHLDKEFRCDRAVVPPGDYVIVEVRDTGDGIPKDKLPKIFEPFFTTKKVGKGTGLGLSTVYGIVKQTGGFIFAESEEGAGSLFTIYLPVNEDVEIEQPEFNNLENPPSDLTGRGNVLLVEDEAPVRSFASRALSMRGYSVTEASSGDEALEVLAECQIQFDVIISDVVMPGKDGPTWVAEAMETLPDIRVVFISGYAEGAFSNGGKDIPNASFLAKPFSLRELTQKVKEQIDA